MKFSLLMFLLAGTLFLAGQNYNGWLPIKNFTRADYSSQAQNWQVKQNPRTGKIYVANKEGLMEYLGKEWRMYKLHNEGDVKSLEISDEGHVYVGGTEEFGYFYADSLTDDNRGKKGLNYFCLSDLLDSNITHYNDIISIANSGEYTYFASSNFLFIWHAGKLSAKKFEEQLHGFVKYRNRVYVSIDVEGLLAIDSNRVSPVKGGDKVLFQDAKSGKKIATISKAHLLMPDGWVLNFSRKSGFYRFKIENNTLYKKDYPFAEEDFIKRHRSTLLASSLDGNLVFGFGNDGILITDRQGHPLRHIDLQSGLQDIKVNGITIDNQGQLWAALSDGVSRINILSPIDYFNPKISGYTGIIDAVTKFNGKIFLAGQGGLFVSADRDEDPYNSLIFKKMTDPLVNMTCFDLLKFDNGAQQFLLVVSFNGIEKIDKNGKITHVTDAIAWVMHQDIRDPNRVWLGLDVGLGLSSIYYTGGAKNGGFVDEGRVPGIKSQCRIVSQDTRGNIWTGSANTASEVVRLSDIEFENHTIKNFSLKVFTAHDGLPENNAIYPAPYQRQMIFGSGTGILLFNDQNGNFEPFNGFGHLFSFKKDGTGKQSHRIIRDSHQNYWIVSKSKDEKKVQLYLKKPGDSIPVKMFQQSGKGDIYNSIFEDEEGIYWIGGTAHLLRFNTQKINNKLPLFLPYIYEVVAGTDTLYEGYFFDGKQSLVQQPASSIPIVAYKNNTLNFKYSSMLRLNEEPALYSYKLKGFSDNWNPWTARADERFINLSEGQYEFVLRVKDRMGNISEPVSFRFEVLPPWYRTIWAYIGYVLFFIAFVWGAITVSTRSLKKIIREATAEIQAQKDELEEKNQNILDSIHYAQRIQVAVTPSESQMKKYFPEHFVLWRPRDIVSGDFFWMMNKGSKTILAAADCTGHGVPGAFMSIMGISFLNQIANLPEVKTAADALNHLRHNVITSLNQEGAETDTKDGMDISLCVYNFEEMLMDFSGAYNPLYMIRDEEITVIKADRMPVGVHERMDRPFTNTKFTMMKGDVYYILSDGYIDQFGGPKGKKFMTKRFKELILRIHKLPMDEQSRILEEELLKWRGDIEQVDDIIIIGVRVV